MKLISYEHQGKNAWGVETDLGIFPGDALAAGEFESVLSVLKAAALNRLRVEVAERSAAFTQWVPVLDIERQKPIPDQVNIVCVGLNYQSHVAEVGRTPGPPSKPSIFLKRTEALVADGESIWVPRESTWLDYEGELAFVLAQPAFHVRAEDAWSYIAGYTIMNDGSVRDYQKTSVTAGKNFYRSGAVGPALVTADEFGPEPIFDLETRLNGQTVQRDSTRSFMVDIPHLLAYITSIMPLAAGDIISTGTPAGVALGLAAPRWLRAGDEIEVHVSGLGVLRNFVVDAS